MLFTTAGVVVLEHFDKRASLAVGIAGSGASAGTIVIPLLTHACIDAYGFRGAFLILSGISLQCLVVSLFFTPPVVRIQGKFYSFNINPFTPRFLKWTFLSIYLDSIYLDMSKLLFQIGGFAHNKDILANRVYPDETAHNGPSH